MTIEEKVLHRYRLTRVQIAIVVCVLCVAFVASRTIELAQRFAIRKPLCDANEEEKAELLYCKKEKESALVPPASTGSSYVYPNVLFGHVHMAKTGGTSFIGILANKFERICANKGHSHNAYSTNERAKKLKAELKEGEDLHIKALMEDIGPRQNFKDIGFEDCDYVSIEGDWEYWKETFGNGTFHDTPMELHVPCRDRIDHLMSQCNYKKKKLDCDAADEKKYFKSVDKCFLQLVNRGTECARYHHNLKDYFDVKCYDFTKQFTSYIEYMSDRGLQPRRFESTPFVKRASNKPRNKSKECIWGRPDLLEKTNKYLLELMPYYQFCDECMGSENEITRDEF